MKKLSISIAIILVLLVGQSAFAAYTSIGISVGYTNLSGKYDLTSIGYPTTNDTFNGVQAVLSSNYYSSSRLSALARIGLALGKTTSTDPGGLVFDTFMANIHAFGKYEVISNQTFGISPQIGLILDIERSEHYFNPSDKEEYERTALLFAAGLYIRATITPRIDAYVDLKFPFLSVGSDSDAVPDGFTSAFKHFLYDVIIGATYEFLPNMALGLELNISNAGVKQFISLASDSDLSSFGFSIGGKFEYRF